MECQELFKTLFSFLHWKFIFKIHCKNENNERKTISNETQLKSTIDLIYQKPCIPEYISDRFRLKFDVNLTLCDYVDVNININIIMNLVSFSFLKLTHFEILSWS